MTENQARGMSEGELELLREEFARCYREMEA